MTVGQLLHIASLNKEEGLILSVTKYGYLCTVFWFGGNHPNILYEVSFGSNLRQILPFPTHKCMIIYGTFCLVPYLLEQPHRMMVNTSQHIQLVHISAGNTNTLGINIFSLWKTNSAATSGEKHLLFIRIFLHQNSFAIIIKSHLLPFLFAGLLMLQQHIWF